MHKNNIILFPGTRDKLLRQMENELKNGNFINALNITDELLTNQFHCKNVYVTRLNCLIQLKQLDEAEQLCEHLMESAKNFYEHYFEYYLFILFELNKFHILMEAYEKANKMISVRSEHREQLDTFYKLAIQMNDVEINKWSQQLEQARKEQNYVLQWQIINKLQQINNNPNKWLISLLEEEKVHPVVKTKIIMWLKEVSNNNEVKVEKFGKVMKFIPKKLLHFKQQEGYIIVKKSLQQVEQKDPSLYRLALQLLNHYYYVMYPMLISKKDADFISEAILAIIKTDLNIQDKFQNDTSNVIKQYIKNIRICNELFLNIVEGT